MLTVILVVNMQIVRKYAWFIFIFCVVFFAFQNKSVASQVIPLPKEQAFQLTPTFLSSNSIRLTWQIAPGYYLYAKKIHVSFSPSVETRIDWPASKIVQDEQNKPYDVYTDSVTVPIIFLTSPSTVSMAVDYQGCSSNGFCYPPMSDYFNLDFSKGQVIKLSPVLSDSIPLASLLTQQNHVETILKTSHTIFILILFAGLGLMLAFTPCVLPMFPILMSIIAGQNKAVTMKQGMFLSISYVLGMAAAYAGIGWVAAYMGRSLQVSLQKPEYILASSILFFLLSLSLFGLYELRLPRCWQNSIAHCNRKFKGGAHVGVFMMGVLATLIVSPCVTAPLAGVLLFIANTGNLMLGSAALFMMGLGMGIPLILIGASQGKWRIRSGAWMELVKYIFGFALLGISIWLLSRIVSYFMITVIAGWVLVLLAVILLFFSPVFDVNRMRHYLAWGAGFSGMIILLFGAYIYFIPNSHLVTRSIVDKNSFIIVRNASELGKQLQLAKAKNKPVIVDFYADWCASCVAMDRDVFGIQLVKQTLKNYTLIRADLSDNTQADEELLKKFKIIAPPTILFFDKNGLELSGQRIVGEINAKEFLERL
jgi:thiol:disulfide interchange protein DsbD